MPGEPPKELLETRFAVGERGLASTLADQESDVELGLGDVDADKVHQASQQSLSAYLPRPSLQSSCPAVLVPHLPSSQEAVTAAGPNTRGRHEA